MSECIKLGAKSMLRHNTFTLSSALKKKLTSIIMNFNLKQKEQMNNRGKIEGVYLQI